MGSGAYLEDWGSLCGSPRFLSVDSRLCFRAVDSTHPAFPTADFAILPREASPEGETSLPVALATEFDPVTGQARRATHGGNYSHRYFGSYSTS
jgi:hypothetical protein